MLKCAVLALLATSIAGQEVRVPLLKRRAIPLHLDSQYRADIDVGTPRQRLSCLVHTGSDITAVAGKDCSRGCDHVAHRFDPSLSSTFKGGRVTQASDWEGRFGASGRDGVDTFTVNNTEVRDQHFIVGNVLEGGYSDIGADCVMGINNGKNSIFHNMWQQNILPQHVIFIHHERLPDGEHFGQIIFGGIDETRIRGEFTFIPIVQDNSWIFNIDDVSMDGESACNKDCRGYVDTSIAVVMGPADHIHKINEKIGCREASGRCEIDCSRIPSLKPIVFTLGGHKFDIHAEHYIQQEGSVCWSGFVADKQSENWRLGDFFLDHVSFACDVTHKQVGFAHARE